MARSTIRTMRVHWVLAYGSDCLDTMHIETRMDIGVATSYANTGTIVHIDDERQAMIDLLDIE